MNEMLVTMTIAHNQRGVDDGTRSELQNNESNWKYIF